MIDVSTTVCLMQLERKAALMAVGEASIWQEKRGQLEALKKGLLQAVATEDQDLDAPRIFARALFRQSKSLSCAIMTRFTHPPRSVDCLAKFSITASHIPSLGKQEGAIYHIKASSPNSRVT